jgi:hypothetical protein
MSCMFAWIFATDRPPCSISQRQLANSGELQRAAYRPAAAAAAVDWSTLMTSPFGAAAAAATGHPGGADCYCLQSCSQAADSVDTSSVWTQSLRFRPYYVWPDPTPSRSGSSHSHHRHAAEMTSSFSAAAPSYVDYQSVFTSSRVQRHSAASATSVSGFHGGSDVGGSSISSSVAGDITGNDVSWVPLPSSFGVGSTSAGLSRHVTAMPPVAASVRHCHSQNNDEFSINGNQATVTGQSYTASNAAVRFVSM